MERKISVNNLVRTWAVPVPRQLINNVLSASATSVAIVVIANFVGGVTLVWCGGPRPLVGFHDVEFRAPVSSSHVCIAVTISVSVHPNVTIRIFTWHLDEIPGGKTATLVVAQIDVPLDGSTEKIWPKVLRVRLIELWGLDQVASAVLWGCDARL